MMKNTTAIVITSISAPNAVMKAYADEAQKHEMDFIVIGDVKSPESFELDGCEYYSIGAQEQLPFRITRNLPKKHYARKNIGYLLARNHEVIIETDDDNFPYDTFWESRKKETEVTFYKDKGWMNVYSLFTTENIWPRGFPLQHLKNPAVESDDRRDVIACPVQQGLADENPDVDAVYRMTMHLPFNFDDRAPVALGENTWSPFNSQNTTWFSEAFPLLYLPSYCSFRMTDIWRSFIAQRIAWTCNWPVMFHKPSVWQERNDHSLLKDFEDEIPGYLGNEKICSMLQSLNLKSGKENIGGNLIRCYEMMTENNFIGREEMGLVEDWLYDITS